ncbi:MAG: alcohol dehydrogenase catalytic domain-containing protein [Nitrososphaera sp.]
MSSITAATTARAAVFYGPGNISVTHRKFPRSGVTLKTRSCCVCGYDARVFRNGHKKVNPPVVLGHEICAEATDDLGSIKAGTRVAVYPVLPCLGCKHCRQERYNLCASMKEIGSTLDGGFSELISIPKEIAQIGGLVPIPDSLSDEEASLIEPLACCVNSISQAGALDRDAAVAIIGDGPMGLLHLQLSRNLLGARTAVIGKVSHRMDAARSLGAEVFSAADDDISEIKEFAAGGGYDLVIVAASEPSALDLAAQLASKGSHINIFAGIKGQAAAAATITTTALDPNLIHYGQISVSGSFSSTPADFERAVHLASNKECAVVDLSRIITHRYSLDDISGALQATEGYRGLRAAVIP